MARTSTNRRANVAASLLQKAKAVGVAHSRGDGRGRTTILACLVLITARLEQETQAVGVGILRGHESGRRTVLACLVLVTARLEQQT